MILVSSCSWTSEESDESVELEVKFYEYPALFGETECYGGSGSKIVNPVISLVDPPVVSYLDREMLIEEVLLIACVSNNSGYGEDVALEIVLASVELFKHVYAQSGLEHAYLVSRGFAEDQLSRRGYLSGGKLENSQIIADGHDEEVILIFKVAPSLGQEI